MRGLTSGGAVACNGRSLSRGHNYCVWSAISGKFGGELVRRLRRSWTLVVRAQCLIVRGEETGLAGECIGIVRGGRGSVEMRMEWIVNSYGGLSDLSVTGWSEA